MSDAYQRELEQHRRWRLKPQHAGMRAFDELLENEFLPPAEHAERARRALRGMLAFAVAETPYYAGLLGRLGLTLRDFGGPEDLPRLPVLTKHDVLQNQQGLEARRLPPGEIAYAISKSSGTTGRPVPVTQTLKNIQMLGLLRHRSARWHELDPMASRVDARPRGDIMSTIGVNTPEGEVVRRAEWRSLGRYFQTGTDYSFNVSTPIERQVELLARLRPAYAMTFPGVFEEWLLANGGRTPADSLKALIGIGSQLTPSLRVRLEEGFGVPVHQTYGLNEIGKVAARCAAGRYHVHTEQCLVEITADDGRPCTPGEIGHLLVTGLNNPAMPLIRYDTGDLAEVVDGPCPCGRTLPSFGEIAGRYRSYAGLPAGTRERVRAIRNAIEGCPPDRLGFLRRYQLYQDLDNRFTLRLRTVAPIPEEFRLAMLAAWAPVLGDPPSPLAIERVDEIAAGANGKLIDFISDFHTDSSLPLRAPVAATGVGA